MLRIYINTWGNYNENGAAYGEWITLPMDEDDLQEKLKSVAEKMNDHDPEWFVNDYEWEEDSYFKVDEMDSYTDLNEICEQISDLDEYDQQKLLAVIEATGSNVQEAIDNLDNYTFYQDMNLEDVAYELVEDCYFTKDTPDIFRNYFDYAALARDLGFDGYYETEYGVISYN